MCVISSRSAISAAGSMAPKVIPNPVPGAPGVTCYPVPNSGNVVCYPGVKKGEKKKPWLEPDSLWRSLSISSPKNSGLTDVALAHALHSCQRRDTRALSCGKHLSVWLANKVQSMLLLGALHPWNTKWKDEETIMKRIVGFICVVEQKLWTCGKFHHTLCMSRKCTTLNVWYHAMTFHVFIHWLLTCPAHRVILSIVANGLNYFSMDPKVSDVVWGITQSRWLHPLKYMRLQNTYNGPVGASQHTVWGFLGCLKIPEHVCCFCPQA